MSFEDALLQLRVEGYRITGDFAIMTRKPGLKVFILRDGNVADIVDKGTGEVLLTVQKG
jgi:hypothetical protein